MKKAVTAAIEAGLTPKQFVAVCEQVADALANLAAVRGQKG